MKKTTGNLWRAGYLVEEFAEQSDRGVAIIGGSYLENAVAALIKADWRKASDSRSAENSLNDLFHNSGPLGSFSAKNKLAFLSQMIGEAFFSDLEIIRDIRNDFAHKLVWDKDSVAHDPLTFETDSVKSRLNNIQIAKSHPGTIFHGIEILPDSPRNKYILAVTTLAIQLYVSAGNWSDPKHQEKSRVILGSPLVTVALPLHTPPDAPPVEGDSTKQQ